MDTGEGAADGQLTEALPAAGTQPETVSIMILTHGHGDHIGDITDTDWSPRFDRQPELARVTRRALSENLPLMAYHFPFPGLGCVVKRGQMAVWEASRPSG